MFRNDLFKGKRILINGSEQVDVDSKRIDLN